MELELTNWQCIDIKSESIEFVGRSESDAASLATAIPDTEPRYSLFRYRHSFEGVELAPLLFIYSCPSGLKVRERMLYASSKQGFLSALRSDLGLEVSKKVCHALSSPMVGY